MAILSRRRQPFDERLPDGRSVYEAVRQLSRGGTPVEETPRPLNPQPISPQEQNGIMMLPGRGYQVLSRDPNYPNEVPSQTNRRLEQNAIWDDPQGDSLRRAASIRDEYGDPTSAQFPVSAVTKSPLYTSGYGAGYNKGPLDPGYEYKSNTIAPRSAPANAELTDRLPTPAIPDLSNTDAYQRDQTIRPHIDPAITDPQAQLSRYEQDVRNYQPQKEGLGKTIARTALGFLQGGIPGAAYTVGNELLDRRQHDKDWQRREIAGADQQLQTIGARRREGMQEDLMRSQIDENKAQAIRAQREPLSRDPGFTLGEGQVRYDASGNQIAARPGKSVSTTPHNPLLRERTNPDGSKTTLQSDDYGKTWTEAPSLGSAAPREKPIETPKDFATRQRNFSAAQSKYKGLAEEEKAAAQQKDAAYAAYSAARARYKENADIQPDVIAAKTEADRAQAHYASFWGKKDAAKAEMLQHGDGVDENGEPLPPKGVTRGQRRGGSAAPSTHGFSISGWLAKNPGKTEADARTFHDADSKYRSYKIIP